MNRTEARRLYQLAMSGLTRLDFRLFAIDEADQLGLDESAERAKLGSALNAATDSVAALARLDPAAGALEPLVSAAVAKARAEPFATVSVALDGDECHERDEYEHPLVLRELVGRLGVIYGLDVDEAHHGLTPPQMQLRRICENIGNSIRYLIQKEVISVPAGEHQVKHVLFATVRAAFPDAVPDGGISFQSTIANHKPDFGVPRLKLCVETKVARDQASLSSAIDGLLADISTYGSNEYTTFLAVIYTDDEALTDEVLRKEVRNREAQAGLNPIHQWKWLIVQGPLKPRRSRAVSSKA